MNSEKDIFNCKSNPELVSQKLRNMPVDFETECLKREFKVLTEEVIKQISGELQVALDSFIDVEFQNIKSKVQKLVELEESSRTRESQGANIQQNFQQSDLEGYRETLLLQSREELFIRLGQAKIESEAAEMEMKNEIEKHKETNNDINS